MFIALSLLLAAACLVPAGGKLSAHEKMLASASHFGIPWTQYRLIGITELAGAAGVLAGILWRPIGAAAAFGVAFLLGGALVFHRRAGDSLREAAPALVSLGVSVAYLGTAFAQ